MPLFIFVTRAGTGIMTSTKLAKMHRIGKKCSLFCKQSFNVLLPENLNNELAKDQESGSEGTPQIARLTVLLPPPRCPWWKYITALATNPCLRSATNPKCVASKSMRRRGGGG